MGDIRPNVVKRKLAAGQAATILSGYNSADVIDFLGQFDFDGIWLEGEHGPVDFGDVPDLTRACDLWGKTSVVRVNSNNYVTVYRTLDLGAQGIVVPHVNTADEARAVVDAGKFHPLGSRGMYTSRQGYGVPDYLQRANDETLLVVLIEDIAAIANLGEIVEVDNIDVFFVAPSDLAQSMGHLGRADHPEVQEVIDGAISQIVGAGRTAGTVVSNATVESYVAKGVRFLMTSWNAWLAAAVRDFARKVDAAPR